MHRNETIRLEYSFDPKHLEEDMHFCLQHAHMCKYDQKHYYSGVWTTLALKNVPGMKDEQMASHEHTKSQNLLLDKCAYFKEILDHFDCPVLSVRLLHIPAYDKVVAHRDPGLSYRFGKFRLHIPIITNEEVLFIVRDKRLHMRSGECWYGDFDLIHEVQNNGSSRRIHLVVDFARNEWSDRLFRRNGYDFEVEKGLQLEDCDSEQIPKIINELQKLKTATSRRLIQQLNEQVKARKS